MLSNPKARRSGHDKYTQSPSAWHGIIRLGSQPLVTDGLRALTGSYKLAVLGSIPSSAPSLSIFRCVWPHERRAGPASNVQGNQNYLR